MRTVPGLAAALLVVAGCAAPATGPAPLPAAVSSWVYQLQGYPQGRLDELVRAPQPLAVIDLARDGHAGWFTAAEVRALRDSGKRVLAYMEIGAMEDYRPEHAAARDAGLLLNRWPAWPRERFVRYWDERWWTSVVRPRLDRALSAGFDGVYLDTPLAYEEIDLSLVPGRDRAWLARAMVHLIVRTSEYAKARRPGFWIVPQNSPELRELTGYLTAVDGIGMEELFFRGTDRPCDAGFCAENLAGARALRDAGKLVLAVDYATTPRHVARACARYRSERFAGYVTVVPLDRAGPPCRSGR